jgi:peptidoglycan-associated lipoprotein
MKAALRLLAVLVGVAVIMTPLGCAKKCVKAEEPIPLPPPPKVEEPIEPGTGPGTATELGLSLNPVHFDFDRSDIRAGDAEVLNNNGNQLIKAAGMGLKPTVTIEGHCDPVGTSEYNMALGQRRAQAAKAFLVKLGVPSGQLATVSFGEEKLVTQVESEFEQNRRCEFKLEGK